MKDKSIKKLTAILFTSLLAGSLVLAYARMGYLPWLGVAASLLGFLFTASFQGKRALNSFFIMAGGLLLAWFLSTYYVYYQWESGEVIETQLNDQTTLRTWVMDDDSQQIVIYEAPPEHIGLLESTTEVSITRDGEQYQAAFNAVRADTLTTAEYERIFALYLEKYQPQTLATDIYYLSLGPKRGSQLYALYSTKK
jgi:hypothetical protein